MELKNTLDDLYDLSKKCRCLTTTNQRQLSVTAQFNRFLIHEGFPPCPAAVVRLKSLANSVSANARPSLATYTQLTFLQCLLAHIVSVAANYVDAHMRAIQRSVLTSGDEGLGFGESTVLREGYFFEGGSRDGSRPTSPKVERAKGGVEAVPLLESGGLNHFVGESPDLGVSKSLINRALSLPLSCNPSWCSAFVRSTGF